MAQSIFSASKMNKRMGRSHFLTGLNISYFGMFLLGVFAGRFFFGSSTPAFYPSSPVVEIVKPPSPSKSVPQVFNFIKELKCRSGHMNVPLILHENGAGKVVVDIGLDAGEEFFAALKSGKS